MIKAENAALLLLSVLFLTAARVKVIDGDSLRLDGAEIRLEGIDAPEYHQYCHTAEGRKYHCGDAAYQALKALAGEDTSCRTLEIDRYRRGVAVCYSGGVEINRQMVRSGWAVAYTRYTEDYVEDEREARAAKRGIWQGKFMKPELYRALQRKKHKN